MYENINTILAMADELDIDQYKTVFSLSNSDLLESIADVCKPESTEELKELMEVARNSIEETDWYISVKEALKQYLYDKQEAMALS